MQKAEVVLSMLSRKSTDNSDFKFSRIYRNLFNQDFYVLAYNNIYSKEGNMTAGTDEETIDGFNYKMVEEIISQIQDESYRPKPVRRTYIPKKNGKLRPLGIPSFRDKLVQEVIRLILQAIYEPIFLDTSHGFRPERSCHTALSEIKKTCRGTNWVIEGDIKGFFDNIDHDVMLQTLSSKIDDGRFIGLIAKFLKAGYMEFKQLHNSLTGTPQGGLISPILANIYLHEFDRYMANICEQNSITDTVRKRNPIYCRLNSARFDAKHQGKTELAQEILKLMRTMNSQDPFDKNYIKVKYVRYADDFLILIIGSKELATGIRDDIKDFLYNKLKLELNMDKTLITNLADERVRFLGYEISKTTDNSVITKNTLGVKKRAVKDTIQLLVPADVIRDKLKPFVENEKAVHHNARINLPLLDLINQYNAEIRGLYNYYCLATDVSTKIGKFKYYHYFSLLKTVARKEKCSIAQVLDKHGVDVKLKQGTGTRNILGVSYQTKDGTKILTYFNESLKKVDKPKDGAIANGIIDVVIPLRHKIIDRINANKCELCGLESDDKNEFEVHHVRKLKDIKSKYMKRGEHIPNWVLTMSSINRKTLVVCKKCHRDIHAGTSEKSLKTAVKDKE